MPEVDRPIDPYLGDCCGLPTPAPRANPWIRPRRLGRFERIIQTAVELLGVCVLAVLISVVVLFAFSSLVRAAEIQYPVAIPNECVELAQREGYPLVIENKMQSIRSRLKLASLSRRDPLVRQGYCARADVQAAHADAARP